MDAEDLIEPEARRRKMPKPHTDVKTDYNWQKKLAIGAAALHLAMRAATLAVDAGVKKRDLFERICLETVRRAPIERFRVDMNADGSLIVLGEVEYLMDRLLEFHLRRRTIRHIKGIGFNELTIARLPV
jgi:hypothetical protein